jgi:8-amino-7-oxononanoate synthase
VRRLRTVESADARQVCIDGRRLLDFASNDYLGLAAHPAVHDALVDGARRWGVGAGAAHLLGGHRAPHDALERALAEWTGREAALLFSTGYMANLGVMQALLARADLCIADKLDHASLLDAARVAGCECKRYVHADVESARRQFAASPGAAALLATDGVFSMDGDVAPLVELANLCRDERATLFVDDAHGLGVLGPQGAGSLAEAGLGEDDAPILMATLGKALGVAGAFVAGSAALIEGLVQFARSHVYTTAMPPALAAATLVALEIARDDDARRATLGKRIVEFRDAARQRGIRVADSRTPIQPVPVGDSGAALAATARLADAGFFVPAIRPPTVPHGSARLRVSLSAAHSAEDVERLVDALATVFA